MQDLKLAFRQLAKTPGFTAVALLTLALGIGVNTSMFSVLRTLVLRTLPFAEPDRLVRVYRTGPGVDSGQHSVANALDLRAQNSVFDHLAILEGAGFSLTTDDRPPEWLRTIRTTADLFPLLGRAPALGRVFTAEENQPGRDNVIVLSHPYWVGRFGADPEILGRQVQLNGESVTIIGVMPPGFEDPMLWGTIDAWRPIAFTPAARANRSNQAFTVFARLKPDATRAQAGAHLDVLSAQLAVAYPDTNAQTGVRLAPLSRGSVMDEGQITFFITGLAVFVLLIACANLANLQFARTAGRAREFAVRAALGASRARLMGQVLAESLLLALAGGLLGVLVALWCNEALGSRFVFGTDTGLAFPLDRQGLAFAFLVSAATGIAFGLLPAWLASRTDVNAALQQSPRGATSSPAQHRVRQALIVSEVALALVLLASAAFFLGGMRRFIERDPGYRTGRLLSGYITLAPPASASTPELRAAYRNNLVGQIETRLAALPGVDGVAFARALPTWGYPGSAPVAIAGQPPATPGRAPSASIVPVSPAFFDLFGIRLLQGRTFTAADRADSPPVVVINETMARTLWPGKSPLGQRIGGTDPARPDWCEVIGVVTDTRSSNFMDTGGRFQTYRPWAQFPLGGGAIVLRSHLNPEALAPALRATVAAIAPDQPVRGIGAIAADVDRSFANFRLAGGMLVAFALLGLLLAAIGIYGVLAHHVQQRTNEIGIRMALGAQVRDVLTLVLGQGLRLTLIGAAIGLAGAFAISRVLAALMPGLPQENLLTAAAVTALLLAVALVACWLPARRAAKVDPIVALRAE